MAHFRPVLATLAILSLTLPPLSAPSLAASADVCPGVPGSWLPCGDKPVKLTPQQAANYRRMMAYSLALQRCRDQVRAYQGATGQAHLSSPYTRCQ